MPKYLYKCSTCKKEFEFVLRVAERNSKQGQLCPKCKYGVLERNVVDETKAFHVFEPGWFEHIDVEPIYIESKEQLFAECEKRGLRPVGYDKTPKLQRHFKEIEFSTRKEVE